MESAAIAPSPVRSSSQWPIDLSMRGRRRLLAMGPGAPPASRRLGECRNLSAAHPERPFPDPVRVLEESSRWRPGRPRAVLVVHAAVTGTHEEPGLREPPDGAAEMGAVDREHLEPLAADPPHPARDARGRPVPGHAERILVHRESRLALREALERAELDPGLGAPPSRRAQDVADHGNTYQDGRDRVQHEAELEQEAAARRRRRPERIVPGTHASALFFLTVARDHGRGRARSPSRDSRPGTGWRWPASQATTSEICSVVRGRPGTSSRQSGLPRSGRPAITVVRSDWSLTSARNDGSTIEPAVGPPLPSGPWHLAHALAYTAAPRSCSAGPAFLACSS